LAWSECVSEHPNSHSLTHTTAGKVLHHSNQSPDARRARVIYVCVWRGRQEFNALVEEHQRVKADLTESLNKAVMRNAALEGLSKDLELVTPVTHCLSRSRASGPVRQAASPRLCSH